MGSPQQPLQHSLQQHLSSGSSEPGRHVGDLARSDQHWAVHLEIRPNPEAGGHWRRHAVTGRLHFLGDNGRRKTSAWIFVERTEQEVLARFNEFSPMELWRIAESLPTAVNGER